MGMGGPRPRSPEASCCRLALVSWAVGGATQASTSPPQRRHAVSRHAVSRHAVSRHAVSRHAVSRHAISRHGCVKARRIKARHIKAWLCQGMPYQGMAVSRHAVSFTRYCTRRRAALLWAGDPMVGAADPRRVPAVRRCRPDRQPLPCVVHRRDDLPADGRRCRSPPSSTTTTCMWTGSYPRRNR